MEWLQERQHSVCPRQGLQGLEFSNNVPGKARDQRFTILNEAHAGRESSKCFSKPSNESILKHVNQRDRMQTKIQT